MTVLLNPFNAATQTPFISEIYFYSGDTGAEEAIEIAGPTGSSLEGWQLLLYDGATGMVYDEHTFGDNAIFPYNVTLEEQDYGTIVQYYGVDGIQDGLDGGDGLALVNPAGGVVEFWSYGEVITALDGAALGLPSILIDGLEEILNEQGISVFNRRCPFLTFCGPDDQPYDPTPKELEKLIAILESYLGDYYYKPVVCGAYTKETQAGGEEEDLLYDRFGNNYSYAELQNIYNSAKNLNCDFSNIQNFNLLIGEVIFNGQVLPTMEQKEVICAVFSYLDNLIRIPSSGTKANIYIGYDFSFINSDIAASASSAYTPDCGVGYGIVQQQLLTTFTSTVVNNTSDFAHGLIYLNPGLSYYSGIDENDEPPVLNPITNSEYDLYTILLHEALHLLGVASKVGMDGNSSEGFYTLWDLHLLSPDHLPMIKANETMASECCKDYEFNRDEDAFPNMPEDILQGCGDVFFNLPELPPVNGEYDTSDGLDDITVINMLSHLDATRPCGSEDYVMHYDIFPGLVHPNGFPNIRRRLTSTELKILCELGYTIPAECSSPCYLLVHDDGSYIIKENSSISYETLLANDNIFSSEYEITFDFDCAETGNLFFINDEDNEKIDIIINGTPFGNYSFCYTITACEEELCETGRVLLTVAEKIDPTICADDCNLIGYGDFELFQPSNFPGPGPLYYPNFISPYDSEFITVQGGQNTVDVCFDESTGNQYLRFLANLGEGENVLLPLCKEVPPGCNLEVKFDACIILNTGTLGIWTLTDLPQNLNLNEAICDNVINDDFGNEIGSCIGSVNVSSCGGTFSSTNNNCFNSIEMDSYCLSTVNNSSNPISYIWMFPVGEAENPFYYIDNVEVTTDCENSVIITPTPITSCIGHPVEIDIQVALDGPLANDMSNVNLEVNLPNISGISFSDFNPDFSNGVASLENLTVGEEPISLSLFFDIDENLFVDGTEINIPLNISADNACLRDGDEQIISFTLETCMEECVDDTDYVVGVNANSHRTIETLIQTHELHPEVTSNKSFFVHGTLEINKDYEFNNCEFIMGTSASILVTTTNFKITGDGNNSSLTSCDYLWKGIKVTEGVKNLNINGTYISDAQYGVQVSDKNSIELVDNTFDNNLVGFYVAPPSSDGLVTFGTVNIVSNIFETTDDLKPAHPIIPLDSGFPAPENVGYAGMLLRAVGGINIGSESSTGFSNVFRNLANGIIASRSNISVYTPHFFNMGQTPDYSIRGHGIYMNGKTQMLTQKGSGQNGPVSFENCRFGIWAKWTYADISANNMINVDQGITIQGGGSQYINVSENTMQCNEKGIAIQEANQAVELEILNNTIDVGHPMAIGINMYGIEISDSAVPDFSTKFKGVIEGNVIDAYQREGGIGILNSKNIQVINNDIEINDPFKHTGGIEVTGSSLIEVRDGNMITRGDIFNVNQLTDLEVFGIRAENSASCTYCCNTVEMINYGVVFDGTTSPSSLGGTQFRDHFQGLRLTNGTSLNEEEAQTHNGNCWNGEYVQWGAIHEGDGADIDGSQFIVNPQERCFLPDPRSPEDGWFDISSIGITFQCGTNPCDQLLVKRELTKTDSLRAAGVETVENVVEEHELSRRLYRNIESLIEYGIVVPEAMNFYNMHSTTSVGQFRTIERGIRDLWQLDDVTLETLHGYNEEMAILFAEIAEKDNALQNASAEDSLQLVADKRLLYEELNNISNNRNDLLHTIQANRESTVTTLLALNNAITVSEIYKVNEKTVNEIYLNTVAQQYLEFTEDEITSLENIAYQCPKDGGYAVYRAQSLLRLTGNSYDFNYNCENLEFRTDNSSNGTVSTEPDLSVHPNPAQNTIEITLSEIFDTDIPLEILDIHGRIVKISYLSANTRSVFMSLNQIPSGIYFLKSRTPKGSILTKRIIISK